MPGYNVIVGKLRYELQATNHITLTVKNKYKENECTFISCLFVLNFLSPFLDSSENSS